MSRGRPSKVVRQDLLKAVDRFGDRQHLVANAEMACELGGIVERDLRGETKRQHDAADALRAQRIDRNRRTQRRVDAAGDAQQHAGKSVLADIVAQAQHASRVIGLVALERRGATGPWQRQPSLPLASSAAS